MISKFINNTSFYCDGYKPRRMIKYLYIAFIMLSLYCLIYVNYCWAQSSSNACPASSFKEFLNRFSEQKSVQGMYTKMPLTYNFYDFDQTTKLPFLKTLQMDDISHVRIFHDGVLFPDRHGRETLELQQKIEKKDNSFIVTLFQPDTDNIYDFRFEKTRDCWVLVMISNLNPT
jgi:hypothetical protein